MHAGLYFVYILTNKWNSVFYIGVTNDLIRRIHEHRSKAFPGFTSRYNITKLVYFVETQDIAGAITREKELKGWLRKRKIALIEQFNPTWEDLWESIQG